MFIILKGNYTLKDLAVVCTVQDYTWITKPPPQCTAMGVCPMNTGNITFFKFLSILFIYNA